MKNFKQFLNEGKMEHYQIGQILMLNGLKRYQSNGKEITLYQPAEIISIDKTDDDIRYTIEVDYELKHRSSYGIEWVTPVSKFYLFHTKDKEFYEPID